jgi:hypothetical protein
VFPSVLVILEPQHCSEALVYIERSIEFVIKVGIEAVGVFESIHLFVYKLMLQNAISGVKQRARLCSEQNGEHFQHLL